MQKQNEKRSPTTVFDRRKTGENMTTRHRRQTNYFSGIINNI